MRSSRKTKPVNIAATLAFALSDVTYADPATLKVRGDVFHPVLSLLQTYLDPSDPLNHAAAMTPAATGGHHVFQVYGQNDSYSPGITPHTYASPELGVAAHDPKLAAPEFTCPPDCLPAFGVETAGALTKNVGGRLTAAVRQYAQPMGADGGLNSTGFSSRTTTRSRPFWRRTSRLLASYSRLRWRMASRLLALYSSLRWRMASRFLALYSRLR